jgi:hypothetical protein
LTCFQVRYCDAVCQKKHWKEGRHKATCKAAGAATPQRARGDARKRGSVDFAKGSASAAVRPDVGRDLTGEKVGLAQNVATMGLRSHVRGAFSSSGSIGAIGVARMVDEINAEVVKQMAGRGDPRLSFSGAPGNAANNISK